jgi:hypothetical protein
LMTYSTDIGLNPSSQASRYLPATFDCRMGGLVSQPRVNTIINHKLDSS